MAESGGRAGASDVTPWPSIPAGHMLRRRSAYLSRPRLRTPETAQRDQPDRVPAD